MAKDKKTAQDIVDKQQKDTNLEHDVTTLPGLSGKGSASTGGKASSNTSSGNGTSGNGKTVGTNNSGKGSSGSSGNSGSTVSNEKTPVSDAIDKFEKELIQDRKDTEAYNERKADENDFDTKKGRSEYYQSLETIKKEKDRAKEKLDEAIGNNSIVGDNKALRETYKNALKAGKKAGKETDKLLKSEESQYNDTVAPLKKQQKDLEGKTKGLDRTNIEGELAETNGELNTYLVMAKEDLRKNVEGLDDQAWLQKFDELEQREKELNEKRDILINQLKDFESLDQLNGEIGELAEQQKAFTSDNVDVLLNWAETSGSDDDKARAATIRSLQDAIFKADEDGIINEEERKQINELIKNCDKIISKEMEADPAIKDAQDAYDSAKAKFSYYLFDQIKSIAVLLIGLSQGNAQMVYSALDNFNKSIAEAESKYNTDTIAAFSNNNVKNLTGDADAEYIVRTQVLPELKKQDAFMNLSEKEKEISVRALEKAFEEYRRYASNGGGDDFRVWFTAQTANGGSGWASVISSLIQAGALNWDSIVKAFGSTQTPTPSKKSPVSFNLGTQGQTNDLMASILKSQSDEITAKQSTPQVAKDKQNTVNQVLASRTGVQGAPQGQALKTGQGWGSNVG